MTGGPLHGGQVRDQGRERFVGHINLGSIRAWDVTAPSEVTVETLAPVFQEGEALELLLLGTGVQAVAISDALRSRFREARIRLDVMQTGAAARTFNVLVAENRKVGAALIAVD